ncbi:hypothetical protein [Flavobacterium sp. LB2P53]|uniref:hypothetical protein n=1 Tax=Flavobacterium sp. LB2P53 TaxID=2497481 RepID=UPI000F81F4E9|nr:hypothetical protein [Flavobacterium sp. LB2P53]RTY69690.1 hypothetical protein EKL95_05890 [Flavobacterium sp. LB2P53]
MSSFLGRKDLSRGVRNNNPGNLVITSDNWTGKVLKSQNTDGRFEQFKEVKFGIRAMIIDIIGDIGKGKNTVRKLISEYAPSFENDTNKYVSVVSSALGVNPDSVIKEVDFLFLLKISRAIITHENGKDGSLIVDSDILDAIDIINRKEVNGVVINSKNKLKYNIIIIPLFLFFYTVLTVAL